MTLRPDPPTSADLRLSPAPRLPGSGRCAAPEDTLRRLTAALDRRGRWRYEEHRVADSLYWGALSVEGLPFPPMGKGATALQCRISTLAEGLEWLALKRRRALRGHRVAHQGQVPDAVRVEDLLAHIATATPEVLSRIKALESAQHWVEGYSLLREQTVQVPLEYVHAIGGTNGLAAGNGLEEAIVQGACEVLERRAAITVARHRMVVPTIDPASIRSPQLRAQLDALSDLGIEVTVKDLSFGGALPCIAACLVNPRLPDELQAHRVLKAAAAFDREAALASCLTEYAQVSQMGAEATAAPREFEQVLCAGADADNFLPLFWFGYLPYPKAEFLEQGERVAFDSGVRLADCLEDIERLKDICRQLGKDLVVVDLTDPDDGFHVVQVVIPGYSDILPYHPPSSPVLFRGWTRELVMGYRKSGAGEPPQPCTAGGLFPDW